MATLVCLFVNGLGACNRITLGVFVHIDTVRQLLFNHVNFVGVFEAFWPLAGVEANHTAHDFSKALHQHDEARKRNDGLEGIERQRVGVEGVFADQP